MNFGHYVTLFTDPHCNHIVLYLINVRINNKNSYTTTRRVGRKSPFTRTVTNYICPLSQESDFKKHQGSFPTIKTHSNNCRCSVSRPPPRTWSSNFQAKTPFPNTGKPIAKVPVCFLDLSLPAYRGSSYKIGGLKANVIYKKKKKKKNCASQRKVIWLTLLLLSILLL